MYKDLNRGEVEKGEQFMLDGSDHIFIEVECDYYPNYPLIADITEGKVYRWEDIEEYEDFKFYRKEEDDDYWGVWVIE